VLSADREQVEGLAKELEQAGVKLYRSKSVDKGTPHCLYGAQKAIRNIVRERHIDVIHTNGLTQLLAACLAVRSLSKKPVLVESEHTSRHISDRWLRLVTIRTLNQCADLVLPVADAVGRELITHGLNPSKVRTVYNAIDLENFNPDQNKACDSIRRIYQPQSNVPTVALIGMLYPWKGHRYYLEAASQVLKIYPEVRFLIVGDGPLKSQLKDMVKHLKIQEHVIFTGLVPNMCIPYILSNIDISVLPSLRENFPHSILEAMAARKPVIASHVGGIPEMIKEGVTGYLIPPRDSVALADRILRLLKDKGLSQTMGHNGRALVEQRFSMDAVTQKLEEAYYWALNRKFRSRL
jgi:glycosyltransferase involved in cell wall biosynthesis